MKQFLVPALLLSLVAVTSVVAAGSVTPTASGRCCPPSPQCPYDDERCLMVKHADAAAAPAAEASPDCARCGEHPDAACCQKKVGCGKCRQEKEAPKPQEADRKP
jgi:hypothetical protein